MHPLDSLFDAAEALPVPVLGDNQIQVNFNAGFFNLPGSVTISGLTGILLFTPSKRVGKGVRSIVPAFFSGACFLFGAGIKMTLTAPNILRPTSNYSLAIQSQGFLSENYTVTSGHASSNSGKSPWGIVIGVIGMELTGLISISL